MPSVLIIAEVEFGSTTSDAPRSHECRCSTWSRCNIPVALRPETQVATRHVAGLPAVSEMASKILLETVHPNLHTIGRMAMTLPRKDNGAWFDTWTSAFMDFAIPPIVHMNVDTMYMVDGRTTARMSNTGRGDIPGCPCRPPGPIVRAWSPWECRARPSVLRSRSTAFHQMDNTVPRRFD